MKTCICAATKMEISPAIADLGYQTLIHGVGIAHTGFSLGKYLAIEKPDLIIQIGMAGSYVPELQIGDTVIVSKDIFADLGAEDYDGSFMHLSEMHFANKQDVFDSEWIESELILLPNNFSTAQAITVNTTNGFLPSILKMKNRYNAQIETMEGAAFFAACITNHIPCIQLRTISNIVEPRNKNNWNIPLALNNLEIALINLLQIYN